MFRTTSSNSLATVSLPLSTLAGGVVAATSMDGEEVSSSSQPLPMVMRDSPRGPRRPRTNDESGGLTRSRTQDEQVRMRMGKRGVCWLLSGMLLGRLPAAFL